MKRMTPAKEYLRKIRMEQKEIKVLAENRAALRASLYPKAIRYDREQVQTSPTDTLPDRVADLCALDDEIVKHLRTLEERKAHAMSIAKQIDDPACRMVIELYYFTMKENGELLMWEDVAASMGYAEKYILRNVHPKALREFERFMKEVTKSY